MNAALFYVYFNSIQIIKSCAKVFGDEDGTIKRECCMNKLFKASLLYFFFILIQIHAATRDCRNGYELTLGDDFVMNFCEIPAANNIKVGSEYGYKNESPVVLRNFSKVFFMGQFEVTQRQYKAIMKSEPWKNADGTLKSGVKVGDNYPAVYIGLFEMQEFLKRIGELDDSAIYRLPTEAEWEFAARSGSNTNFYWGPHFNKDFVFYAGNSFGFAEHAREVTSCPNKFIDYNFPGYCGNFYGLMHMSGNVWERTIDVYDGASDYSKVSKDGHEIVTGEGIGTVIRGGGWRDSSYQSRVSNRLGSPEDLDGPDMGFRVLRMPK